MQQYKFEDKLKEKSKKLREGLIVTKSVKLQGYQSVSCRDFEFLL